MNASLAFEDCAAHVGGDGWGDKTGSLEDLQVRAYVTQLSVNEILARVSNQGLHVALGMGDKNAHITASREQVWEHIEIWYSFLAYDYYAARSFNFYIRDIGEYRIVFVFMGPERDGEMGSILKSVVIPREQHK